jgi:hypothetical protein
MGRSDEIRALQRSATAEQVGLQSRNVGLCAPASMAPKLHFQELSLYLSTTRHDSPLLLHLSQHILRVPEKPSGEGVPVLLVLETGRVEVLAYYMHVQLSHRWHLRAFKFQSGL